jgi:hypothetical protein
MSALQFLCETSNDPPVQAPPAPNARDDHIYLDRQRRTGDALRRRGSIESHEQRIQLARLCLLGALQARTRASFDPGVLDMIQDTIDRKTFLTTLVLLRGRNILVHSTIRSSIDDCLLNRY